MSQRIVIDPITRLEGHGKIDILLDDKGNVDHAYFQIPELRGFEKFAEGRPAEDMPQITPRICGVCPTAHHMASTKTLDDLYQVEPPIAARKVRELVNSTFFVEDHAIHFYYLEVAASNAVHVSLFIGGAVVFVSHMGLVGYGWAEVAAILSYAIVYVSLIKLIGRPKILAVGSLWLGFCLGLFWQQLGLWVFAVLVAVLVWTPDWRALIRYATDLRLKGRTL